MDVDSPSTSLAPKRARTTSKDDDESTLTTSKSVVSQSGGVENGASIIIAPIFVDQYHVVKRILEFLKIRDVLSAATVNKQWSEIGRIVRKQRKNCPRVLLYHPYSPHHALAFEYFNGRKVSDEAKKLVESGDNGLPPHKNNPKIRFPHVLLATKSYFQKTFLDFYDEPQMLISFGTTSFLRNFSHDEDASDHLKKSDERMGFVLGEISETIPCLTSFSCGMIAATPDQTKSIELEKQSYPCLSSMTIPKVPGLKVKVFAVAKNQIRELKENPTLDKCKEILGITPENEPNLKAIMYLHKATVRDSPLINVIHEYLRQNPKVAFAGGIHEAVMASGHPDSSVVVGGVLFFGDELVRASSVALEDDQISDDNREKVEKLKHGLIPDGKSFAFMFACNGRGYRMHKRPNVEADLFHSLLPSTPLIGAFTFGEFCHEVIHPIGTDTVVEPPERIDFAYTTVFLVISYKHPSEE